LDSRFPKLIFAFLALYAAVYFFAAYPKLPDVVASHFDAHGMPNGWQSKQAFFGVMVIVSLATVVLGFAIPKMIAVLPQQLINPPNKDYWLAPERRAETLAFLGASFARFACALLFFNILVFGYAVQINLRPDHPPSVARLVYTLIGFLAFVIFWLVRIFTKFRRPPEVNASS
jgi:uncharacterized membrane protein